jgi:hypothetical protein
MNMLDLRAWRLGRKSLRILGALLSAMILLALLMPQPLWAHAGGAPVLTDVPAGSYRLYGWMLPDPPRVGEVHLALAVTLAPPEGVTNPLVEPVTDATVQVTFTPQSGTTAPVVTTATLEQDLGGFYYELDVRLPVADQWTITVDVTGPAGEGSAAFEREVLAARQVNWTVVASATLALLLLIGLMGIWRRLQGAGADAAPVSKRRAVNR